MDKTIEINGIKIYLKADEVRFLLNGRIVPQGYYVCYFKLTEPNVIVYGEMLRDENNKPILFQTPDDAFVHVENILNEE